MFIFSADMNSWIHSWCTNRVSILETSGDVFDQPKTTNSWNLGTVKRCKKASSRNDVFSRTFIILIFRAAHKDSDKKLRDRTPWHEAFRGLRLGQTFGFGLDRLCWRRWGCLAFFLGSRDGDGRESFQEVETEMDRQTCQDANSDRFNGWFFQLPSIFCLGLFLRRKWNIATNDDSNFTLPMVSFSGSNEIDILILNNKFASTHQTSVWVDTTSKTIIINITHERKDLHVEVNQMFYSHHQVEA